MLELLSGFVAELRTAGVPVSMGEHVDAAHALSVIDLGDRDAMRLGLRAALVKRSDYQAAFDRTFALYFATRRTPDEIATTQTASAPESPETSTTPSERSASGSEMVQQIADAIASGNLRDQREMASLAVDRFAGIEAGRPVGAAYYLYRTMRQLRIDEVEAQLRSGHEVLSPLEQRIADEVVTDQLAQFREFVEGEIMERLIEDRGVAEMVAASRTSMLEDIDVMQANRDELERLERALVPLSRKMAARLAQKRRRRRRGPLDMRRTMRESLSTGGVPIDVRFRPPHPTKPELVILADMSGSVASFARFTLLLVHALNNEFSKVRSFVFVDGVDEVTQFFDEDDPAVAADRIVSEANMIAADGHSDYGLAFTHFAARYLDALSPRATLLVLGDARSNYHPACADTFDALTRKVRRTYWLNPEPQSYWESGDSVLSQYATYCDDVFECRTLRQLEAFVMGLK